MSWHNTRAGSGHRAPQRTSNYGLNSAYALSQILFAVMALLALSQGLIILGRWPGLSLGFLAATSCMAICVLFLEYWQPRMTMALFVVLLAAAALTPYK
jgi:ribose/xylose/arabinose/galactoside ABC-type transport system permease subunit